ncbi:UDP-glycosyltransferase 88A1-like [Mangifera indica]|uniref:UDP-glycosyltransferase 88A1-like n=1 Tax=Mangifera indica TaxID=29780 RepID=UPI001CF9C232|nr:UDP-glycosyltransferase 88A1-like [Mangifera indica]
MEAIVMYPSPAIGHLISMVELAKLILSHRPSLSIHIIIFEPPYDAGSTATYINKVSSTIPSIIFHRLPTITLPQSLISSAKIPETLTFEVLLLNNPNLEQALVSISNNVNIFAFIADFFCYAALSVTAKLNIPTYEFITSGAGSLSLVLCFPSMHKNTNKKFKDMDALLHIPGIPPIPAKDMPTPMLERDDKIYQFLLDASILLPKSAGIIVNTFESLEPRAVKTMTAGLGAPDGPLPPCPPLYCIGPLIVSNNRGVSDTSHGGSGGGSGDSYSKPECLVWLDRQPSQSVVFLCFGSLGRFSVEQLKEIAVGLERSGERFLWVVKNPPHFDDSDFNSIFPAGFLDRTKERGFIVKSWAPQAEILNHESVGGFVTHCGWNSVLEAVCAGVPMVAWPLYAEQRCNKILLVEEIKIALPMMESTENGFVNSSEVEKRVRELMNSEEGNSVRKKTKAMKDEAKAALNDGGSSCVALIKLFESWKPK